MYRTILYPDQKHHTIEMPKKFFGKKVEVIVMEISDQEYKAIPQPPAGKKVTPADLLENFGSAPDFPSIEEVRAKAWPSKW